MLEAITIIALIIAGILVYATTRPESFRVVRSLAMKATPEQIFPLINNLSRQSTWSPFEKDPNMKRTITGPEEGTGAKYEWDGNRDVGAGRIQITGSTPPKHVAMRLEMSRPFKADNIVEFTLDPAQDGSTVVIWSMHGPQPYMAKLVSIFIDCDKMCGTEFEKGLASLKALVENPDTSN